VDHHLKDLIERELATEPPMPPGSAAGDAMAAGTRLRRRRTFLTAGGTATAAVAVVIAAVSAFGSPLPGDPTTAPAAQVWCPVPQQEALAPAQFTEGRAQVAIFLTEDVTAAQRTSLDMALQAHPLVTDVKYESREEAFRRFVDLWSDEPDLIKAVQPDQLPEAFRVTLKDPDSYPAFVDSLRAVHGINDIVGQNPTQCTATRPGTRR
jgi:cell division transport system permease protein